MSLCIFSNDTSIKLNDSYIVSIKWKKDDTVYTVLNSCTSFQPPTSKFKKEVQQIGNNSYAFLIPDWEVGDLTLTLLENRECNVGKIVSQMMQYLFDFNDDKWYYKENNIYEILVDVYNNNFNKIVYRYVYRYVKLVKYETYELDYWSDNLLSYSLTFAYMFSSESTVNITIDTKTTKSSNQNEPPLETTSNMPSLNVPNTRHQEQNTGQQSSQTGGQSAADAAAKALAAQKAKMEQDSKTEQAQTPAADPKTNNDQEILLDNVDIKANEGQSKTKETAATNPVDLNKLSGNDRIDELAYRMMRGQLDNGKARYDKTYKAGYTESERAAAQAIINQKDWEGLKERHDARVAIKDTHYSTTAETEVAKTDYTPNKDLTQSRSAETSTPTTQSTGGQDAADAAAKARLAAEKRNKSQDVTVNTKPTEKKHETVKPKTRSNTNS